MDKLKPVVHELFAHGLESKETALGFHGTSWEAIEELLRTGALPPSSSKNLKGVTHAAGRVYFHLTPQALPKHPLVHTFRKTHQEVIHEVEGYAEDIARTHAFMKALGLDLGDRSFTDARAAASQMGRQRRIRSLERFFSDLNASHHYKRLRGLGITDEEIRRALEIAATRNGIVLSIRRSVMDVFKIAEGDKDNGDLSIVCPDGLPVEHISGLEPMGDFEYEQLDQLVEETENVIWLISSSQT